MAAAYRNRVEFLLVYIREAHPTDGWQVQANLRDQVLLESAKSFEHKEENASACVRKLDIRFPTLIDNLDNKVELAYSAWPDRLYLIGKDGKIVYKSAPGPAGFRPSELESAIEKLLSQEK
jgi:type I thyroxine 5'-deiodinase